MLGSTPPGVFTLGGTDVTDTDTGATRLRLGLLVTGGNEPIHATGGTEPQHFTGGREVVLV